MTIVFDGKEFAGKKEKLLSYEVAKLQRDGITPKLVSILVGNDSGSKLYLSLKKKAAERIGAILEIRSWKQGAGYGSLMGEIRRLNKDKSVHGVMIQLPFPKIFTWDERQEIINTISPKKDVDGMRDDSQFVAPVVKAILQSIEEAREVLNLDLDSKLFAVVGANGFVGNKIMKELRTMNYELMGYDIDTKNLGGELVKADIIISATGIPDLILGNMVKEGAVVIDVGSPKGDVEFSEVSKKASFITPVPGGVGPVTIVCLLENLIASASKK